jgi:hypothetical protein
VTNASPVDIRSTGPMLLFGVGEAAPCWGSGEARSSKLTARAELGESRAQGPKRTNLAPSSSDEPELKRERNLCGCYERLDLAEAEVSPVHPHPMHDDSELARHSDQGLLHADPLYELQTPDFESRPLLGDPEMRIGGFIKRVTQ